MCIKLVSIKELYYDARPNKSQNLQNVGNDLQITGCPNVEGKNTNILAVPKAIKYSKFRKKYVILAKTFDMILYDMTYDMV